MTQSRLAALYCVVCLPSNFCWVAQYFCSSSKYFLSINSLFVPITDMELILDRRRGGQPLSHGCVGCSVITGTTEISTVGVCQTATTRRLTALTSDLLLLTGHHQHWPLIGCPATALSCHWSAGPNNNWFVGCPRVKPPAERERERDDQLIWRGEFLHHPARSDHNRSDQTQPSPPSSLTNKYHSKVFIRAFCVLLIIRPIIE